MIPNLKSAVTFFSFYFLQSYPKVVSPPFGPFSVTCVDVATVRKWLYKYQLYPFSSFFFLLLQIFLQIWKIQLVGIVSHMWCRYNMHHVPHSYVSWLSISIPDIKVLPFGRRFFKHHEFVCLPKCELWPCLTSFCPLLADRELFISWMFGFCHRHCTATLSNN